MGRPSKTKRLDVLMNGERVGHWTVSAQGLHEFRYDHAWLVSEQARPISLSMPLQPTEIPYRGQAVESFFENLLPDSADVRRRVQTRFSAASASAFDLLAEIGRDCVGAIQLLPPDRTPENIERIEGEALDEHGVANALRSATSNAPADLGDDNAFRLSIAGAQEKTAFLMHRDQWHKPLGATPTTHIFKLPLGRVGNMQADLSTSVENEWLCAQIIRAFGLPIAQCDIADFEDQHVLIVERFDRKLAGNTAWWMRLPQEDMCQATATPPGLRYEADGGPGIADIGALLLGSRDAADRRRFFKTLVLFWLLCATDGHAKNFSISIGPRGRFALTPLYDVISAYPIIGNGANQLAKQKVRMAMAVIGKNRHYRWAEIQFRHWQSTAAAIGLQATAGRDIAELVEQVPGVVESVSGLLPRGFPDSVSVPIFDGLVRAARRLGSDSRRKG